MIEIKLEYPLTINPKDFEVGVIIMRAQVAELHDCHRQLIDTVCNNHKKVIIMLGVPVVGQTEKNPLDFSTRAKMVLDSYSNVIVLPLKDQRYDELWSSLLDNKLNEVFHGGGTFLLYGSRDSFIPHYKGRYKTVEMVSNYVELSGSEIRKEIARGVLTTSEARKGVIYANFGRYRSVHPTVDIACLNDKGELLMAKKPNEKGWRFIGGYTDVSDESYEAAAKREFAEESGGSEIADLRYVASAQIKDWRYKGEKDGIMTTLFIGKFVFGNATPTDDIAELQWIDWRALKVSEVMEEHQELFKKLQDYIEQNITEKV